ncbi:hypothetical protein [Mesorhizobium sp. M0053]|uniref:hypothetical protein n=1 Tax=Mesorhizobium sp. M0053 TaxID=2956864 RepID=UPI00333809CE
MRGNQSRYQTIETRLADLNQRVVDNPDLRLGGPAGRSLPSPCCSCRKCCAGSTALTILFGIGISVLQPVKAVMRFDPLGQTGALHRAPITNANACLMVSSVLSEPVPARPSAEEQLN